MELILSQNQDLTWQNILVCIGVEEPLPSRTSTVLQNLGLLPFEEGKFYNSDGTTASQMGSTKGAWRYKYVQRINEKFRYMSLYEVCLTDKNDWMVSS